MGAICGGKNAPNIGGDTPRLTRQLRHVTIRYMRKLHTRNSEICEAYRAGMSSIKLGKLFGLSTGRILHILLAYGVPRRARGSRRLLFPNGERECRECRLTKPFSEFHRCSRRASGVRSVCKSCANNRYLRTAIVSNCALDKP